MFATLRTERLVVRQPTPDDVANLYARRNDPEVAKMQDWEYPYPMEKAQALIDSVIEMGEPTNEEWWLGIVALHDGEVVGDLAVNLTWEGRTAEVGYNLHREHWGKGYATEALTALVDYLFDARGVTRVFGMLDPANPASARVLERTGMLFEGHTKSSFWDGDVVSDDLIYGMVKKDRNAWRDRPRHEPDEVTFVEVSVENFERLAQLETHESQKAFVAPTLWSYSDALFPEVVDGAPVVPWMRGVLADGEMAGFVMLALSSEHHAEPYLWRLLIDRMHQRRGIGRRVVEMVVQVCKERGDTSLRTSWEEGIGSPRPFYEGLGFVTTGRIVDEETEARLVF
ncbi:MAG TPA: GNAT family N-acetyltransferase [Acidimicrobiia bacterium]|nr:GNAT family N-acetyltransferase [Acidimicrobiia bacterium]